VDSPSTIVGLTPKSSIAPSDQMAHEPFALAPRLTTYFASPKPTLERQIAMSWRPQSAMCQKLTLATLSLLLEAGVEFARQVFIANGMMKKTALD
ncbi:hypothetical protein, partial [Pantoea sp. FN0305]|uniref:hypothetical protein n=1 Tax=Pantoea sp. FN0305 TaxID=3418559 RepID=UPI003CF9F4D0